MGSDTDKNDNERSLDNDNDIAPATRLPEDELVTTTRIAEQSDAEQAEESIEQGYVPRSTVRKLLPIVIMLGLMLSEFIFCYKVAEDGDNLLSIQFLLGTPLFIGATTVYLASYYKPITTSRVFLLTFWLVLGILVISVPILKEGTICIVMASPIIYVALLIGGLGMRLVCLKLWKTKALYSVALLPLLVLFAPLEPMPETYQVTDSILIQAAPEQFGRLSITLTILTLQAFIKKVTCCLLCKCLRPSRLLLFGKIINGFASVNGMAVSSLMSL